MRSPMDWFSFGRPDSRRPASMDREGKQANGSDASVFRRSLGALASKLEELARHDATAPVRTAAPRSAPSAAPR